MYRKYEWNETKHFRRINYFLKKQFVYYRWDCSIETYSNSVLPLYYTNISRNVWFRMLICPNILYSRDSSISQIKWAGNSLKIKQVCGSTAQSLNLQYSLNFQKAMYSVSFSHFQIRIFHKNVSRKIKLQFLSQENEKIKSWHLYPLRLLKCMFVEAPSFSAPTPPLFFGPIYSEKRFLEEKVCRCIHNAAGKKNQGSCWETPVLG